jgi:glycosyltransferase involved in cell wall biosynthesis
VTFSLDSLNPWTWISTSQDIIGWCPDVVVVQSWTSFLSLLTGVLARLVRRRRIPIVAVVHNVLPHQERVFDRALASWVLAGCTGYLVLSESEEIRLRRLLPASHAIRCVRHPVYGQFLHQAMDRALARKTLGFPPSQTIALHFGFIRQYKGLEVLIEAMKFLRSPDHRIGLVIAGEFWVDKDIYLERIEALGLTELVKVYDHYIPPEEVGLYFSASDVFVAPYTGGTQSGSMQIAVAFGMPIVCTEHLAQGIPDDYHAPARIVPPHNAEELAEAIAALAKPSRGGLSPLLRWEEGWDNLADAIHDLADS